MTAPVGGPGVGLPASAAASVTVPVAGDRGRLDIADRVIAKIAAQAVAEVDQATGVARRVLGVSVGDDGQARVSARLDGQVARVDVALAVNWPCDVLAVTRRVRAHIRDQLLAHADVRTAQVDVEVVELRRPALARSARVQ